MYSITARDLAAAGANLETIVPATLTLTNKGKQIPIFVRGEDDKKFDPTDEIIFYGERQHGERVISIPIPTRISIGFPGVPDPGSEWGYEDFTPPKIK